MRSSALLLTLALGMAFGAGEGLYQGAWSSSSGTMGGYIGITVEANRSTMGLNVNGQERVCEKSSVRIQGTKLTATCSLTILRAPHEAVFTGEISGNEVKGTYSLKPTGSEGDQDKGTWHATRRNPAR